MYIIKDAGLKTLLTDTFSELKPSFSDIHSQFTLARLHKNLSNKYPHLKVNSNFPTYTKALSRAVTDPTIHKTIGELGWNILRTQV
jgi:hypothetical protein